MTTLPSHRGGSRSWILQSPLSVKGRTWEELRNMKLSPKGSHGHFLPIIKNAIGNGKRILDIGASDCCMTCCVIENTENTALAIDIVDEPKLNLNAEKMIELAGLSNQIEFRPGVNATFHLPMEENSFDSSTAFAVLEHTWCPGHQNIIENMIKVSKEKCIFLIPVLSSSGPHDRWGISPYIEGAGHINQFDEYRIRRCFGRHPYFFEIYRNRGGLPCWLIVMDLEIEQKTDGGKIKWAQHLNP